MGYKNLIFVKLLWQELMHKDDRFIEGLTDSQKGLYLMLLLLAGATSNNIKNDENYIKRVLNLSENTQKIRENLGKILEVYPKLISQNGFLKFKNFNKLHNYIHKSYVTPEEVLGTSQNKNRIRVIEEYIKIKNIPVILPDGLIDKPLRTYVYKRFARPSKDLIVLSKNRPEKIIEFMNWMNEEYGKKRLDWTLETVLKHFPEAMGDKNKKPLPDSLKGLDK